MSRLQIYNDQKLKNKKSTKLIFSICCELIFCFYTSLKYLEHSLNLLINLKVLLEDVGVMVSGQNMGYPLSHTAHIFRNRFVPPLTHSSYIQKQVSFLYRLTGVLLFLLILLLLLILFYSSYRLIV